MATSSIAVNGSNGAPIKADPEHAKQVQDALQMCKRGGALGRVNSGKSIMCPRHCRLSGDESKLSYYGKTRRNWLQWVGTSKEKNVDISEVIEVRPGWNSDNFNKAQLTPGFAEKCPENNCFSVVFRHPHFFQKSIDLFTTTDIECQAWKLTLEHLIHDRKKQQHKFDETAWLAEAFERADTNNDSILTFEELWKLLQKHLHLEISKEYATQVFDRARRRQETEKKAVIDMMMPIKLKLGQPGLSKDGFVSFFKLLTHRPALEDLIAKFSSDDDGNTLSPDNVSQFLKVEQRMDVDVAHCVELIDKYEPDEALRCSQRMGMNGFRRMLISDDYGSLMTKESRYTLQDMTRPLNEYWINSSHNTYLTGGQVRGDASVEGYVNAIQQGARLVELDMWDGSDGEPCIYHGHTLVRPITLVDTCETLKDYAFKFSPYPLILSIENHCSLDQQIKAAHIFKTALGPMLYVRPADASFDESMPSPAALKHKIILKAKMLPDMLMRSVDDEATDACLGYGEMSGDEESEAESEMGAGSVRGCPPASPQRLAVNQSPQSSRSGSPTSTRRASVTSARKRSVIKHAANNKFARELSAIVGIPAQKITDLRENLKTHTVDSMCSLVEGKAEKFIELNPSALLNYSDKHLIKAYPNGLRTDSSNMNPVPMWMHGLQCVTLNMQTSCEAVDLNHALFRQNQRCGYVLKPSALRGLNESTAADVYGGGSSEVQLVVTIISGQCLPKPDTSDVKDVLDPYVTIETHNGVKGRKERTQWMHDNGFNPTWNETFAFAVRDPAVTFLRFCVKDHSATGVNDFVGEYSALVSTLRPGYAHIPLRTGFRHITDAASNLFVHIKILNC